MSALSGLALRVPPANLQAEQAVLGALLSNNKAYDSVAGWLRGEHFADPIHGRIYDAIARRIDAGRMVDVLILRGEFEYAGALEEVGGLDYLSRLLVATIGIANVGDYGRAVLDAWHRRELIDIAGELMARAYAPGEAGAREIHEAAEERLSALADGQEGEAAPVPAHTAMALAIDEAWKLRDTPGGLVGLSTGLRGLDDITGGLKRAEMVVVGARPSMGKTSLALTVAVGAARAGARVLFVTMEMSSTDLGAQIAAGVTPIARDLTTRGKARYQDDLGRFRWRAMAEAEHAAMMAAQRAMADRRLLLLDLRVPTMSALRSAVRRLRRRGGLDLVVLDYLGLMRVPELARFGNRTLEVTRLSGDLKAMAMDFDMPVLVLSQLNRTVEARDVKAPTLADLRDSGAIEQDADAVMFLHRDEYYLSRKKHERGDKESAEDFANRQSRHAEALRLAEGMATVSVQKNRKGRVGDVALAFNAAETWFCDVPEVGG
jgi:replicative DNA helicase